MRRKWITRFTFERVDRRTTCKGVRSKNLTIWSTERVRIFLEGICISVVIVLKRILRKLQSRISSLARKGVIFTGKGITNIVIKITGPPGIKYSKKNIFNFNYYLDWKFAESGSKDFSPKLVVVSGCKEISFINWQTKVGIRADNCDRHTQTQDCKLSE